MGADTYAGHLTSHHEYWTGNYGADREMLSSKRSIKSKAYGMEHGNWMGMDASIQDKTLQDTTTAEQSRIHGQHNFGSSLLQHKAAQISSANPSTNVILPFGDQSTIIQDDTFLNQTQNRTLV